MEADGAGRKIHRPSRRTGVFWKQYPRIKWNVISEDPTEGLTLTRALNIKGVADNAARESVKTEASVMFKTGR